MSVQYMAAIRGIIASSIKDLIPARLPATPRLHHQQKNRTIPSTTNRYTTKPTMTTIRLTIPMTTTSKPLCLRTNRSLRSSLKGCQELRTTFLISRIAFSTLQVQNRSFRSPVFENILLSINLLNPILHFHHREYIAIMSTLPFLTFVFLNLAPTSGWKMEN